MSWTRFLKPFVIYEYFLYTSWSWTLNFWLHILLTNSANSYNKQTLFSCSEFTCWILICLRFSFLFVSFCFVSYSLPLLPTQSRCRGCLFSLDHTQKLSIFTWSNSDTHHSRQNSSGRGMGPSQRPLPDNTNTHKRQTTMPAVGFKPTIPASARPQT
jgi:hypothetical protein